MPKDPGGLHSVKPLHEDIQKKNVKISGFLKERVPAVELPDGTGDMHPLENYLYFFRKRTALERFVIAYGDG